MVEATAQPEDAPPSTLLIFVIADVRGYTRYTFEHGDEAGAALALRFAEVTEEVVKTRAGRVTELRGDEALVVFASARQAIRSAIELQERFAAERRRNPALPLHIGLGIEAGDTIPVKGGFRGGALNVAARLCSLAGSGDTFITETVAKLAGKTPGISFADRGQVSLKGLPAPLHVFQAGAEGELAETLPPLQQTIVESPNNLPLEVTPFVGRRREIGAVVELLRRPAVRLVTLTGPGGIGKTRLALRAAETILEECPDGVFLVSLAAIADPSLVLPTLAQTLGVGEESGKPISETLREHLRDKQMLLVLDNFEHVRAAGPQVGDLLAAAPGLRMLVTSRALLNEYGEHAFEVQPLATPNGYRFTDPAALLRFESVTLFCQCARAAKASFGLSDSNAAAVAEICRRLDGLPLAIELAAARIRILPPQSLSARLGSRLQLLTGGARGLPERQQTLRAAIDWSYSLLDEPARRLFARLSVFAGGCTLEAVEAICGADAGGDALPGITVLVENSLVRQEGEDEPRFRMLETIREYAISLLEAGGEAAKLRDRHAAYYLELAEMAEPELRGAGQIHWLRRLDTEHPNLRAALEWDLERGDAESGLRLAGAIWNFWWSRGYLSEGRKWLETLLALRSDDTAIVAKALNGAANLAWSQGDLDRAEALHQQALELRRELGDGRGTALSLNNLGVVTESHGEFVRAAEWYEQGLSVARGLGDDWLLALLLGNLGGVMGNQGKFERAGRLAEESLALYRRLGDRVSEERILNNLVSIALDQGAFRRAAGLQRESLVLCRQLGNQENVAACLEGSARILASVEQTEAAARLWGAAAAVRRSIGQTLTPAAREEQDRLLARARSLIAPELFAAAWSAGEALPPEAAQEFALESLVLD